MAVQEPLDALLDPRQSLRLFVKWGRTAAEWLGPFGDERARREAYEQVPMGYKAFWLLRRVGVWGDGAWHWDADGEEARSGNLELVAFERPGAEHLWRGSRFEDPLTTLVEGRAAGDRLALCVLERTVDWH